MCMREVYTKKYTKKIHKITDPVELKSMKTLLIKYLFLSMQEN